MFGYNNTSALQNSNIKLPSADNAAIIKDGGLIDASKLRAVDGVDTNYVKLKNINQKNIPEIKLDFNMDFYNTAVAEASDGFICGSMEKAEAVADSKDSFLVPKIRKVDRTGKIIWERVYDYKIYSGRLNNLLLFPDGSFIFSVQTYMYYKENEPIKQNSFIAKCSENGKLLWKSDFVDNSEELLNNIFITRNNEIITAGQSQNHNGSIIITKLDSKGSILKQRGFGGSDIDYLNDARFDNEIGIIINGRTQSKDGDFAAVKGQSSGEFIACIDEELNLKWVSKSGAEENFAYNLLEISEGNIYVPGNDIIIKDQLRIPSCFVIKLDRNGKRVWKKSGLSKEPGINAMSILKNGDIVLCGGYLNKGIMITLDRNGNLKKKVDDLKFAANGITSTMDGGFIVTAFREIKTVPQPLAISCIWYDTELVAVKYGKDYSLEWRKTYDKYHDKIDRDFVYPLKDGKLIVN
jgi:hypothetical protein